MLAPLRKHAFGEPEPPKKPRRYKESEVQKKVVAWVRPQPNWMVLRLENAQQRTHGAVARDKQMGMHPGAPDLILIYKRAVIWLELKSETGVLSMEQENCHAELRKRGQIILVAHGYADAISKLARTAELCDAP